MAIGWITLSALLLAFALLAAAIGRDRPKDTPEPEEAYLDAESEEPHQEDTLHPQGYEPVFVAAVTDEEITLAAQTVWGEARGIYSQMEQAAVVWCALNRVDEWGDSLGKIVTAPHQFAWSADNPTVDDYGRDLEELVLDVVARWEREHNGEWGVGRVLPHGYLWFGGANGRNWFRADFESFDHLWGWHLPNPYES